MKRIRWMAVTSIVAAAACGGGDGVGAGEGVTTRDSAGVAIVEHSAEAVGGVPTAHLGEPAFAAGLFAWLNKPIDGIFLAAAMTIVGLSVNDTVVVFDRIRERWWGSKPDESFMDVANKAAVETIPRTVNTGLGAMFILAALAFLGGDSLQDFAIALLVGLVVGTFSSVFVATPLLTYMQPKWPMGRVKKEKVVRAPEDSGAVV